MTRALTLLLALSAVARADEPSPTARAEASTRFGRGVQLFEAQDYAAALAEFEAAHRLVPRYQVLFNVGVTQKKLFRYHEAVLTLGRYLEEAGAQVAPERRQEVERELAEMRALVAEVTVHVDGLPASLEVDGRLVAETPLARALLLSPGKHELRATREGCEPARRNIAVVSGERLEVRLNPRPLAQAPTTATLTLSVRPATAALTLDGRPLARGGWRGEVDPGGHEVRAEAVGFHPARTELLLSAGQVRALALELVALPRPLPAYKRWYVWTVVALVVAGGIAAGVGGYFATRATDWAIPYPR